MKEKGNSSKRFHYISVIIIIIVILALSLYIFFQDTSISAMKFRDEADSIAKDWHEDAILSGVSAEWQYVNNDGTSDQWNYGYCSFTEHDDNLYKYEELIVVFNSNGLKDIYYHNISSTYLLPDNSDIWLIDSNEAYDFAINNEDINGYITNYSMNLEGIDLLYDNNAGWNWFLYFRGEDQNQTIDLDVNVDPKTGDILHYQTFSTPTP